MTSIRRPSNNIITSHIQAPKCAQAFKASMQGIACLTRCASVLSLTAGIVTLGLPTGPSRLHLLLKHSSLCSLDSAALLLTSQHHKALTPHVTEAPRPPKFFAYVPS